MAGRREEKFRGHRQKKSFKQKFDELTDGWFGYVVYGALGIFFAFLLNQALALALSSDLPVVAVVTGSMVHDGTTAVNHYKWLEKNLGYNNSYIDSWPISNGFLIGDMPVVQGSNEYNVGDVVVYSAPGQSVPVIHRIVEINADGTYRTKGDHNPEDDVAGRIVSKYISKSQIHGRVIFIIPKLGYFKVIVSDIWAKLTGGLL
jgi:hypothetical protein